MSKQKDKKTVNYFRVFLKTVITILKSIPQLCINAWNKNNSSRMDKSEYDDLTPNKTADNVQEYFRALDLAISNPDIKNIAITGPYGAGKSSVICSYLKQRPTLKAINISLATFIATEVEKKKQKNEEESSCPENREIKKEEYEIVEFDEEELEKGILKQLFYKVNYRKIPQSRYRKIHKHGLLRIILLIFVVAANGVFGAWLLGNDVIIKTGRQACERLINKGFTTEMSKMIIIVFVTGILFLLAYFVWFISTRVRFGGVKISDKVEVSTQNSEKETVFNRNLDEIIYFFESTDYEVVFIEDLDRFKNSEIFIKLRELNMLINNYDMIKRKVIFVYAVRDDMFENTDRTKFFDFIIPIVPYINSTNSGEIMRSLLGLGVVEKEVSVPEHKVSDRFVTLVSPYISDMRVLRSIMNEFWVYIGTIKEGQNLPSLKDENMLGLMVFKNMFPREFANLEGESGIVKLAFQDKKDFVKKMIKPLEEIVDTNTELLQAIEKDILNDIAELKTAFLGYLVGYTGVATNIQAENVQYNISQIMREDFKFNLLNVKNMRVLNWTANAQGNQNLIDGFNDDPVVKKYFDRYNILINSVEDRKEELRKVVEESKVQLRNVSEMSLSKLIEEYSAEEILSSDVKKNKLLVFLLRHGYIDEDYGNYINYFHPESITTEEMHFVLGIRNHNAVGDFSYKLEHCDKIVARLEVFEFEQKEILNYSLVDYILQNLNSKNEKYRRIIKLITNRTQESKNFIKSYIDRGKNTKELLGAVCHESEFIWKDFDTDTENTQISKEKYFRLILESCTIEDICKNEYYDTFCENGGIKAYFEGDKDILLKLKSVLDVKIGKIIEELGILFANITIEGVNKELLDFIFDGQHYVLNKIMIENLFEFKSPEQKRQLYSSNYTAILNLAYKPLLDYVYKDFVAYITEFVLEVEGNDNESIEAIEDVLERLSEENLDICISLIGKQKNAFWNSISECVINNQNKVLIWNHLIENAKVTISWDNYVAYHKQFGLTGALCDFVDKNMQELILSDRPDELTEEMINELLGTDISVQSFEVLLDNCMVNKFTNELTHFTEDKLQLLIDKQYFPFTVERYLEITKISLELAIDFAVNNKDDFMDKLSECELNVSDITLLIKRNEFNEKDILAILKYITSDDVDIDIAMHLREFKFNLPRELVDAAWNCLEKDMKYELLYNQIAVFTLDELAEKFKELGGVYKPFESRWKKKFELWPDEYNKKLCKKLLEIGFLTSCREENVLGEFDPVTSQRKKQKMLVGYVKQK